MDVRQSRQRPVVPNSERAGTVIQLQTVDNSGDHMMAMMARLDGSARSEISLLSGLTPERIDELGGVREED